MDQHTYSAQTSITISEDKPENCHVVACELTDRANQTTLTLTQSNNPTQQDADSMVEQGWKPIPHALRQLVEGAQKEEGAYQCQR